MSSIADQLRFEPASLPPESEALREEVREFLNTELQDYSVYKEVIVGKPMMPSLARARRQRLVRSNPSKRIWRTRTLGF